MTILYNYMFRPLLAIFRLSSRELKVLLYIYIYIYIYIVRACDGEIKPGCRDLSITCAHNIYVGCPTRYRTRHFFNNLPLMRILQLNLKRTTDTFLFISHTTNVLLFKFRCNIFIGVTIIKEIPGSVARVGHTVVGP